MEKSQSGPNLPSSSVSLIDRNKDLFAGKNLKPSTREILEEVCRDFENLESYASSKIETGEIKTGNFSGHESMRSHVNLNTNKDASRSESHEVDIPHNIVSKQDSNHKPSDSPTTESPKDISSNVLLLKDNDVSASNCTEKESQSQDCINSAENVLPQNIISNKDLSSSLAELADAEIVQTSDNSVSIIITNPRLIKVLTKMKNNENKSQSSCSTSTNPNTVLNAVESVSSVESTNKSSYKRTMKCLKSSEIKTSVESSPKLIDSSHCEITSINNSDTRSQIFSFQNSPPYRGRVKVSSKPNIDTNPQTKARRITAKMKAEWAKELEKSGHLECPMIGCFQTYVTVANFQTHYKWCTGKKDLKHCPYCDSLIFSSYNAVLHHMEVEHPEKVEEYKAKFPETDKLEGQESTSVIISENEDTDLYVEEISTKSTNFPKKISVSAKENCLSDKNSALKNKMKSINEAEIENIKEFKKCVRFDNIVHKLNSVSEVAKTVNVLQSVTDVTMTPKPRKRRLILTESVVEEKKYFEDSDDNSNEEGKSDSEQINTKARVVLNMERYKRYNESLKLTRDWASERKTYSRSRASDNCVDSSSVIDVQNDSIQDIHQLDENTESMNLSLQTENDLLSQNLSIEFSNANKSGKGLSIDPEFISEGTQGTDMCKEKCENFISISEARPTFKSQVARVPCYNQSNKPTVVTKGELTRKSPMKLSPIIVYGKSAPEELDSRTCDFDSLVKTSTPVKIPNKKAHFDEARNNISESVENSPLLTNYHIRPMAKEDAKHPNSRSLQNVSENKHMKTNNMKHYESAKPNQNFVSGNKVKSKLIINGKNTSSAKNNQQKHNPRQPFTKATLRGKYCRSKKSYKLLSNEATKQNKRLSKHVSVMASSNKESNARKLRKSNISSKEKNGPLYRAKYVPREVGCKKPFNVKTQKKLVSTSKHKEVNEVKNDNFTDTSLNSKIEKMISENLEKSEMSCNFTNNEPGVNTDNTLFDDKYMTESQSTSLSNIKCSEIVNQEGKGQIGQSNSLISDVPNEDISNVESSVQNKCNDSVNEKIEISVQKVKRGRGRPRKNNVKSIVKSSGDCMIPDMSVDLTSEISNTSKDSSLNVITSKYSESVTSAEGNIEDVKYKRSNLKNSKQSPIRKSERVRKRKIAEDFTFTLESDIKKKPKVLSPILISENANLKSETLHQDELKSIAPKRSRRGRPRKYPRQTDISCRKDDSENQTDTSKTIEDDNNIINLSAKLVGTVSDKSIIPSDSCISSKQNSDINQSDNLLPKERSSSKAKVIQAEVYNVPDNTSDESKLQTSEDCMEVETNDAAAEVTSKRKLRPLRASASKAQKTMLNALGKSHLDMDSSSDKSWKSGTEESTSVESDHEGKKNSKKKKYKHSTEHSSWKSKKKGSKNQHSLPSIDLSLFAKRLIEHQNEVLFPNFKPEKKMWEPLSEAAESFPLWQSSVPFKIQKDGFECEKEWIELKCFESSSSNDGINSAVLFTGGPISSSAWCPTPPSKDAMQYIIVSTNCSTDKFSYSFTEPRKGLIQLWNFGYLRDSVLKCKPTMELAISHNHGVVLEMVWCPYGCWEDPHKVLSEDDMPRLGLLAVACSDSYVRIYSIPHPSSLSVGNTLPIFCSWSSALLQPLFSQPGCERSVCCSLNWQVTDRCKRIAAGYGNGMICIWLVNSTATLHLNTSNELQKTITPYLVFQAHGLPVLSVAFAPLDGGRWLTSSSFDKTLKFWNLWETNVPFASLKKGYARDAHWAMHCCDIFGGQYEGQSSKTFSKECGLEAYPVDYVFDPMPTFTKSSCSEFLNSLATADISGSVFVSFRNTSATDSESKSSFKIHQVFKTNVAVVNNEAVMENTSENNELNEDILSTINNMKDVIDVLDELSIKVTELTLEDIDVPYEEDGCSNKSLISPSAFPDSLSCFPSNKFCISETNMESISESVNCLLDDLKEIITVNCFSDNLAKDIHSSDVKNQEKEFLDSLFHNDVSATSLLHKNDTVKNKKFGMDSISNFNNSLLHDPKTNYSYCKLENVQQKNYNNSVAFESNENIIDELYDSTSHSIHDNEFCDSPQLSFKDTVKNEDSNIINLLIALCEEVSQNVISCRQAESDDNTCVLQNIYEGRELYKKPLTEKAYNLFKSKGVSNLDKNISECSSSNNEYESDKNQLLSLLSSSFDCNLQNSNLVSQNEFISMSKSEVSHMLEHTENSLSISLPVTYFSCSQSSQSAALTSVSNSKSPELEKSALLCNLSTNSERDNKNKIGDSLLNCTSSNSQDIKIVPSDGEVSTQLNSISNIQSNNNLMCDNSLLKKALLSDNSNKRVGNVSVNSENFVLKTKENNECNEKYLEGKISSNKEQSLTCLKDLKTKRVNASDEKIESMHSCKCDFIVDIDYKKLSVAKCPVHEGDFLKCGLVFKDVDLEHLEDSTLNLPKQDSCLATHNFCAMNTVAWNPNFGCSFWLFSAGQSGLGRLSILSKTKSQEKVSQTKIT